MTPSDKGKSALKMLLTGAASAMVPDLSVKDIGSGAAGKLAVALGYFSQGDYDASAREAAGALRLNPTFFHAHLLQARTYTAQGRYDEAIVAYRAALEASPQQSWVRIMLANVYAEVDRRAEAIAECETAIRRDPAFAQAHLTLGNLLFEAEDLARAEAAFREALRLNPQLAAARLRLAAILAARDDGPGAADEATQLLRFQPQSAMAHLGIGDRHLEAREYDAALEEYRAAARISPKWGLTYFKLGSVFLERGQYAEAIAEYRIALQLNAEVAAAHHHLGRAYAGMGSLDEAVVEYEAAVAAEPTRVEAWVDLGQALETQGRVPEAVQAYGKAAELEPALAAASRRLADLRGDGAAGGGQGAEAEGTRRSPGAGPLVGTVVRQAPEGASVVRYTLDREDLRVHREHAAGGRVPVRAESPPVLAHAMVVELAAEAAVTTAPALRPIALRGVRVHRWVAFDDDCVTLEVAVLRRSEHDVEVQVRQSRDGGDDDGDQDALVLTGTVVLDRALPVPPRAAALPLENDRPARWAPREPSGACPLQAWLQGSTFRGVRSVDRLGEDGAEATLHAFPTAGVLGTESKLPFLIEPDLLDAAEQVVGFWDADRRDPTTVALLMGVRELHLYRRPLRSPERARGQLRVLHADEERVVADVDLVDDDGRLLMALKGWAARRVHVPDRLRAFLLDPARETLTTSFRLPLPEGDALGRRVSLAAVPDAASELWSAWIAHLALGPSERSPWRTVEGPERARREWLLGCVAAKDALRALVRVRRGIDLGPGDLAVLRDAGGRPVAQGDWAGLGIAPPLLSLVHAGDEAVAIVVDGGRGGRLGAAAARLASQGGDAPFTWTADERDLLTGLAPNLRAEWILRLECAKAAVAEALDFGRRPGSQELVVTTLDVSAGGVAIVPSAAVVRACPDLRDRVTVSTMREGDVVIAAVVCGRMGSG